MPRLSAVGISGLQAGEDVNWMRTFSVLVAPTVAFFTWLITYRLTKRSERRKEIEAKIDKLCEKINEIHELAYQYHTNETEDKNLASEILVKIKILSKDLNLSNLLEFSQMNFLIIKLRRAVTFNNFDTRDFGSKRPNDPLLKSVDEACDKLKTSLDASRHV